MRLAARTVAVAIGALVPSPASPQTLDVHHPPVECVVAQRFPALSARIDPVDRVARARAYFRADGGRHWYYVEMKAQDGLYKGTLPRPRKGTKRIEYYIEAVDTASASTRTPDYTPAVGGSAAECSRATAVAGTTGVPSVVVVHAPPGAPALPAGFETSGIAAGTAAGAAGAAVAATTVAAGAGGGGIGTAAIVAGGVLVAGGAAAAVTLGGGDEGDGGEDGGDDGGSCGTVAITDRTATTLTVTWSGGQPTDGVYVVDAGRVPAGSECSLHSHERPSIVLRATSVVVTGLSPATTYSVHVHPAGTPCSTCETGYNLTDTVGTAIATTLGQ